MKERWFNYRPIFLVFSFLLLGSVFAFYIIDNLLATSIIATIIFIVFLVIAILKKKAKYVIIPIVAFLIGSLSFYIAVYNFKSTKVRTIPDNIQVRISNITNEYNGTRIVEADNCIFDGKKGDGNIILYVKDVTGLFNNIQVGNIIEFKPYAFEKTNLLKYSTPNSKYYSKNLKYTVTVYAYNINFITTDKTLAENFRENVKENLNNGLTNENAEIAYSALFGDKDMLSDKQYSAYKMSGVAHLLAVSGLHVGIIVVILTFILNKLKANKWLKLVFIGVFLAIYTYLCGFALSIIRASIMALVLLLSKNLGKQYDSLNSISIAGLVIFLINPLCVFDVGFLLSFSCVLGITLFYSTFKTILSRTNMNEKLINAITISTATSLTIIIVMACFFKTLNIISLVANVILIPIFTVAFTFIFAMSLISLIIPPISYLMYPANYVFDFINISANILGHLPISNFETIDISFISILVYFVLLLFLSRFCTSKKRHKLFATVPILIVLVICLLI